MYTPVNPKFTIKWGVRGSTLHGHVVSLFTVYFLTFPLPVHYYTGCNVDNFFVFLRLLFFAVLLLYVT